MSEVMRYLMLDGKYPDGAPDSWFGDGGLPVVAASDYDALKIEHSQELSRRLSIESDYALLEEDHDKLKAQVDALKQRVETLEDGIVACSWKKYRHYETIRPGVLAVVIDKDQWYRLAEMIEPAKFQVEPKSLMPRSHATSGDT